MLARARLSSQWLEEHIRSHGGAMIVSTEIVID